MQKNHETNQRHWTMSMNKTKKTKANKSNPKTIEFEKLKIIDMTSNSYQISSKYAFEFMMRLAYIYLYFIILSCFYYYYCMLLWQQQQT